MSLQLQKAGVLLPPSMHQGNGFMNISHISYMFVHCYLCHLLYIVLHNISSVSSIFYCFQIRHPVNTG